MAKRFQRIADNRNLHAGRRFHPYNRSLVQRARELRRNATIEEKRLWKFLRKLPVNVHRQMVIDHYIVDFYIASHKLIIEVDGSQHYLEEGMESDTKRTSVLEGYGLRILRISNEAVRIRFDDVCKNILHELGINTNTETG